MKIQPKQKTKKNVQVVIWQSYHETIDNENDHQSMKIKCPIILVCHKNLFIALCNLHFFQ